MLLLSIDDEGKGLTGALFILTLHIRLKPKQNLNFDNSKYDFDQFKNSGFPRLKRYKTSMEY